MDRWNIAKCILLLQVYEHLQQNLIAGIFQYYIRDNDFM